MKSAARVGRNDPCPCGSGEKYKRCCEKKAQAGAGGGLTLYVVIAALIAAVILGLSSLGRDTASGGRRVWSPEHGHYHTVP